MVRTSSRFTNPHEVVLYSDVDGTLIPKSNQLPKCVVECLESFTEMGFGFSLATGRSFGAVQRILELLPVNAPVVLCNGAYVYDPARDRCWWTVLEPRVVHAIFRDLSKQAGIWLYMDSSDCSLLVSHEDATRDPFLRQEGIQATYVKHADALMEHADIVKFGIKLIDADPAKRANTLKFVVSMLKPYSNRIRYCFSSDNYLEVIPAGISKWSGIRVSHSMLGLRNRKIYTVGDHYNDLEMIEHADVGMAMGNAVSEVKRVADIIVGQVEDHAILDVVATILKHERDSRKRSNAW
jgi:Cof subfamily protein (haloacid dehalogenase superfamily)